jgi:hypothetical protein
MRDGEEFPPPTVFTIDGITYRLADGFHRMAAYRRAHPDVQEIQCEVRTGDLEDAVLFACGANASHGLPRSNSDKRKAVQALTARGLALCKPSTIGVIKNGPGPTPSISPSAGFVSAAINPLCACAILDASRLASQAS